ncbi:flagellar basal body L-ring protein FlgH [Glacieibacterium sp.]|uniref:flagellar basal body L-ring protein FlgH n=1 Tax=Glacieibacterium sp. TaxID=2860237 RepID=UPI003AFF7F70
MFRPWVLGLAALAGGCALTPFASTPPVEPTYAPLPRPVMATGSLYDPARYAALASDNRAGRVGDLLTIRLVERTQARKSATADSKRDGSTSLTLPSVPPFSYVPKGLLSGGTAQSFKGSGTAAQDNLLSGEITVTVRQRLSNGILLVGGEKRLTLNRGEEQIQLTGLVRPEDISTDNSVLSTRVADARIRYSGSGQIADQSREGWLARFFAKVAPL